MSYEYFLKIGMPNFWKIWNSKLTGGPVCSHTQALHEAFYIYNSFTPYDIQFI